MEAQFRWEVQADVAWPPSGGEATHTQDRQKSCIHRNSAECLYRVCFLKYTSIHFTLSLPPVKPKLKRKFFCAFALRRNEPGVQLELKCWLEPHLQDPGN